MELLFNIQQEDGQIVEGVYFISYDIPVRGAKGSPILMYWPSHIKAFNWNDEELNININNSNIIKVYNQETKEDYTEILTAKFKRMSGFLNRSGSFPFARRNETIE